MADFRREFQDKNVIVMDRSVAGREIGPRPVMRDVVMTGDRHDPARKHPADRTARRRRVEIRPAPRQRKTHNNRDSFPAVSGSTRPPVESLRGGVARRAQTPSSVRPGHEATAWTGEAEFRRGPPAERATSPEPASCRALCHPDRRVSVAARRPGEDAVALGVDGELVLVIRRPDRGAASPDYLRGLEPHPGRTD